MTELEKRVKEYLDYLEIEKNRSPKTRENYGRYLSVFLAFAKIKIPEKSPPSSCATSVFVWRVIR